MTALRNTAWLRMRHRQLANVPGMAIHDLNPYTDIDVLIKKIFEIGEDIEWSWPGNTYRIGHISYTVTRHGQEIHVQMQNHGQAAFIINSQNLQGHFDYLVNETDPIELFAAGNILVEPGMVDTLILTLATQISPVDLFVIKSGNFHLFIEVGI